MKISVIELTSAHYIFLLTISKIFSDEEVTFFVKGDMYNKIKNRLEKKHTVKVIKLKSIREINKLENNLIIFTTLQKKYFTILLYIYLLKGKKILCVHNINSFFNAETKYSLKENTKYLLRKLALKKIDIINVYGENLKKYILTFTQKKITTLPFSMYFNQEEESNPLKKEKLKIVIPGQVEMRRRDYQTVYNVMERVYSEKLDVELVLLGKPNDEEGIKIVEKYEKLDKKVQVFYNWVDSETYVRHMKGSNIILGNLNENIFHGQTKEIYGKSKESGITYNAIEYSHPCILNCRIETPEEIKSSVVCYKNEEELFNIIKTLYYDEKKLIFLRNEAINNSLKFSKSSLVKKIKQELGDAI